MKPMLLSLFLLLFFSSCLHYNYYFLSGKNLSAAEPPRLVSEDDTLRIEYDFATDRGKIGMRIENKTDDFIEVDWKKSAVVIGGRAVSFYNSQALISGTIQIDTGRNRALVQLENPAYHADLKANIIISEPVEFLFPRSYIRKTPPATAITSNLSPVGRLAENEGEKIGLPIQRGFKVTYKKVQYSGEKSPLKFNILLTFRMGKGTDQKEFHREHPFFISEIWQSEFDENTFPKGMLKSPNRLN